MNTDIVVNYVCVQSSLEAFCGSVAFIVSIACMATTYSLKRRTIRSADSSHSIAQ